MKNKTFLDSVKCAIKGLWFAVKTEKNFLYYNFIFLLFLILNIVFRTHYLSYITIILFTTGVFSTECINTAIEYFIDMVDKEIKEEIIENLEEAQLKNKKSKNADLSNLLNLFGVNNLTKTNKDLDDVMDWLEDDTADLNVVEQYSYTVDNSELVISLNAENDIIINNEDDFIMIPKKQINFLIETLNKLTSDKIG